MGKDCRFFWVKWIPRYFIISWSKKNRKGVPVIKRTKIIRTGSYLPPKIIKNDDFVGIVDTSDSWIRERTGIVERRMAVGEGVFDLARKAAEAAVGGTDPADIDMIVCSTSTPDGGYPSIACRLQAAVGAWNAFCFDISAACTGFIYALDIVQSYVAAGKVKRALVVSAEHLSSALDYTDRSTCVLFGDGAGAVLVEAGDEEGIAATYLASDGSGADKLYARIGHAGNPFNPPAERVPLYMDGREVFRFAVTVMPKAINAVLEKAGLEIGDIGHILPHQANLRIIDHVVQKYKLDPEKVAINIDRYGNTSSACIPIALDELSRQGKLKKGERILAVAFGAGMTYGSLIVEWSGN